MTSLSALTTLLEQATSERDQIRAGLQRAEEVARRARAQCEQLSQYRGEYRQRWQARFAQEGAIEIVQCYRGFMERLEDALAQQDRQADAAASQCTRLRERLAAAELRVASVKKLIERRQAEQQRVQARRDQRQTDEAARQAHWRRGNEEALSS